MERETNEDIKKQVEELKELLQTIEVKDKESQDDMIHINKQLNKVLKKINQNK